MTEQQKLKPKCKTVTDVQCEDFCEDTLLKQQLSSEPARSHAFVWTRRKTLYTSLLLLLIVGGVMAMVVPGYLRYNKNSNNTGAQAVMWTGNEYWSNDDDRLPQLRSASSYGKSKSPKDLGQMNIYIRKPTHDGARQKPGHFRFPVARYDRKGFPLKGPFLSLAPWIPIFVDRYTRQTIIYSPAGGVYIIPPLINFYGTLYSVGELIKYGYASLVSSGAESMAPINMLSCFQPIPLYGPGIPRINSRTGGFTGGIRTNYDDFNIPKYGKPSMDDYSSYEPAEKEAEEYGKDTRRPQRYHEREDDDDDEDTYRRPQHYYKKSPARSRTTPANTTNSDSYHRISGYNITKPRSLRNKNRTVSKGASNNRHFRRRLNFCARRLRVDKLKRKFLSSKVPKVELEVDNVEIDDVENETDDLEDENDDLEVEADDTGAENSRTISLENCNCQQGVLKPSDLFEHALFIVLHLSTEDDSSLKRACRRLPLLISKILQTHPDASLEATIGIGYDRTRQWLRKAKIPFPKSFIEYKERVGPTGQSMPSTGGDFFLDIRSTRKDLCFELGKKFYRIISTKAIHRMENTFGYAYMSSRVTGLAKDFIGFEDGNDNPEGYTARAEAALIGELDDDPMHAGGSYALSQKWVHNLTKWEELTQKYQEHVIGRTKGDRSIEKEPKIRTSHVGRTHLEEDGKEIEIVRRSLPHGDLKEHGLYFVAYASNPIKFEKLLDSMVGKRNGVHDHLMNFTQTVTGNYWLIPSKTLLTVLFQSNHQHNPPSNS